MLETALVRLIRHRLAEAQRGHTLTLSVRRSHDAQVQGLLFSVIDDPLPASQPVAGAATASEPEPRAVRATISALGGRVCTLEAALAGHFVDVRRLS